MNTVAMIIGYIFLSIPVGWALWVAYIVVKQIVSELAEMIMIKFRRHAPDE